MNQPLPSLATLLAGWDGHHRSLVSAIAPLTAEQLAWRPSPGFNSVGELARHIALGRIVWFERMGAPGSAELVAAIDAWQQDGDGNRDIDESALPIAEDAAALVSWLERSWAMIEQTLQSWNVGDLPESYRHTWNGDTYTVSRQWTIWRILAHDLHHGGQLALMLGMQGVEAFELSALFGHITLPPLADAS